MHHDSGRLGANLVPTDVEPHGHHHGGSLPGPGLPEWSADRERAWLSQEQGEEELPEPICGGCGKLIDETSADAGVIHFA